MPSPTTQNKGVVAMDEEIFKMKMQMQGMYVGAKLEELIEDSIEDNIPVSVIAAVLANGIFRLREVTESALKEAQGDGNVAANVIQEDLENIDRILVRATVQYAQIKGFNVEAN
jgi:hypothetical protein